jgi:hypothetical protein
MLRLVAAVALCALVPLPAAAEPLPSGYIGPLFGGTSGTGADNKRLGYGVIPFGLQAAWQPTTTERPYGWTIRWSTMFGRLYNGNAAKIDDLLLTVQMDVMVGVRYRPWATPRRYLTLRGGGELLRVNQPIPRTSDDTMTHRNFLGGVASIGLDQYLPGSFMMNVDVRYGLIGTGPEQLSVLVGIGFTGP